MTLRPVATSGLENYTRYFSTPALFRSIYNSLFIATIKGSLVAGYFMHLISERKLVYAVLILTLIFFLALIFLPLGGYFGRVQ